jgi:predicted esterase
MFQPPGASFLQPESTVLQIPVATEKKLRNFEQRHLIVPRSARYAIMGSFDAELAEVWIICHGYAQLARRFLSRFLSLERPDRLFVAPEALSRFYLEPPRAGLRAALTPVGASWMTAEDREVEIDDYVNYLDLLHDHIFDLVDRASVRLWVLGFSQGTATVARWVARGNVEPDRVVLYSGLLPSELDKEGAARLAKRSPLTIALGTKDDFARPELIAAQEARLQELRVSHITIRFDGGHELLPEVLQRLAEPTTT